MESLWLGVWADTRWETPAGKEHKMYVGIVSMTVTLQLLVQIATAAKLLCYFSSWSRYRTGAGQFLPELIDPFLCSHLVYAFAIINHASEVTQYEWKEENLYRSFVALKNRNPRLKTLLSVREEESAGSQFSLMMSAPANRKTFIRSSVKFLRTHGFDGLDLDWVYRGAGGGGAEARRGFTLLCKELSEAYQAESEGGRTTRLLLSAAVAAQTNASETGYDLSEIPKYLDFISVKTFDLLGGQEEMTAHHSSLYSENKENIDHVIGSLMDRGAPAGKLLLGFSSHARAFTLSTSATELGAPVHGPAGPGPYTQQIGVWSYYETCSFLRGTSVQWVDAQKVPYAAKGNHWVGFDNQRSYRAKVDYLRSRELGGAAVWTLDMDDFSGRFCELGKYPLISHLRYKLREGGSKGETTPAAAPHTTSSSASDSSRVTGWRLTTAETEPAISCFQNITVVYPASSFCTHRGDGLYVNPGRPEALFTCVRRKTYVTRCHSPPPEHSTAAATTPSTLAMVRLVLVALFHFFRVWRM